MPRADSPKDASARRRSGRIPKPPPTRRPATLSSSHPSKDPTNSTSYSVAQAAARDKDRDPNTGGPNETILWKHPAELEFIYPDDYSQSDIISFLIQNAFSIPPPPPTTGKSGSAAPSTPGAPTTPGGSSDAPSSMEDFTVITAVDGTPTILPLGYRIPLMFAAKYLWDSVRLVLTSVDPPPETEWEAYKYDILNLSRLCSAFLAEARNAMKARRGKGMSKRWRSQMFDRVLTRYHWGWLVNREEYIRAFWNEFREDEYEKDVLRRVASTFYLLFELI
ncbi:hypothetical protein BDQ12DRAFT_667148 [Crucibulum laeve]|uniref:Uncharacterized protein n=1 Tax=Crucibulum laeve TaxID=68775 RepID=A0A5C3LXS3_9AGAR|nr:hypothetical protein BDQ12DRAFT_667148 [Crucibulum laeve]